MFARPELASHLIQLYAEARDRREIVLHAYVVMPDHYHVVLTLRNETSISGLVRKIHSFLAQHCRKTTGTRGTIWQRRFYDHVVRDDRDWHAKVGYVHDNPVLSGLVPNLVDYPWSSGRFWHTGEGPVRCDGLMWD